MTSTSGRGIVSVRAHAKLNLDLRVVGVRPDGYHELRTIFQTLSLHDTLTVRQGARGLELRSSAPGLPLDQTNLVWRAAEAMWALLGGEGVPNVTIEIDKHVPAEAGLGGGSADAAATILALETFWESPLAEAARLEVASRLGSDVPFFLLGGTALGRGRGERLEPLPPLPEHAVVLVKPAFGVATRDAYRWFDEWSGAPGVETPIPASAEDWGSTLAGAANDLQPPVAARHPEIGQLVGRLRGSGASLAAMSGSGSAVFGLFPRMEDAESVAQEIVRSGRTVVVTTTLDEAGYRRSAAPERVES
jgi:4-diphosphocytidyl-2-C-methyl-D-erythritol kinase